MGLFFLPGVLLFQVCCVTHLGVVGVFQDPGVICVAGSHPQKLAAGVCVCVRVHVQ